MFILTFQNHTDCPLTDFGGKTSIFSHPVYLFLRKFSLQDSRGGSLSHMWYSEISEYLISRGKTFATPAWVKDALKHTYLGYETKDLVDVVTGEITTIQSLRHTSDLDTGEMYVFLCKVEAWAMNIGCHLTIPQSCEFQLLRDKQEA
ncbi:hypothetical protein ACNF2W_06320 [Escherichia coli]